jgi:hypothetical protein
MKTPALPSSRHRATFPAVACSRLEPSVLLEHNSVGMLRYAEGNVNPLEGSGAMEIAFTQHHGSELVKAKPSTGESQAVEALKYPEDSAQWEMVKYDGADPMYRYPTLGTVPIFGYDRVEAGIGQEIFPDNIMLPPDEPDGWTGKASDRPASVSFGSKAPPSQPTRRSARAKNPKKKFFMFRSPFLRCIFPHPERGVKFSFFPRDDARQGERGSPTGILPFVHVM